jgi:hypothetical protein
MSSGGQQPVTQQTQQTRDPWGPAQGPLQESMNIARGYISNDTGYQPWTGATQAGIDPTLQAGLNAQANIFNQNLGGSAGVNAARDLGTQTIKDQGFSPELRSLYEQAQGDQNPYLQNILNTSNRQISDKIGSSMSGAGRYGSGQHTDVAARAMAEAADPVLAQDYARRQQQMQSIAGGAQQAAGQWAQMMPTLDAAQLAPAQGLANLGQFYQERAQRGIEDQIKLWNAQQARPWEQVARLNAIAGQAGALGGTQFGTQTTPINQPSTLQKFFGGAAAGAGIGGSFGGPVGGAAGAGIGGLLGLL